MEQVLNLTPHAISVADVDGNIVVTYPPSGVAARLAISQEVVGELGGALIKRTVFGDTSGVPDAVVGTMYIVSTLIAQHVKRADVVSPDTGPTALRKDGQVVAVKGFQSFVD